MQPRAAEWTIPMKNSFLPLLLLIPIGLSGCASTQSGESYSRSEARTVQQVEYGVIEQLRPVKIEGTKTPIGSGAGAAAGGIAGSSDRQIVFAGGRSAKILLAIQDVRK